MKGLKTMAKKKETEPKGTDKKNEKINGEKTDNVEIEVGKEVPEAESLASQLKDVNDRLLRTLAEYDNFRKRSQKEKEAAYSDSKALVLAELLPVMDNFERAAENKNASPEDYMKGIDMIYNQFSEVFKKLGVESFGERAIPLTQISTMRLCTRTTKTKRKTSLPTYFQKAISLATKYCVPQWSRLPIK